MPSRFINFNLPMVVTEQIGTTKGIFNNFGFSDWIRQSRNATYGVLRWLCCHLNKPDVL